MSTVLDRLRPAIAEAVGLVLPVECAGCGSWDHVLCPRCRAVLSAAPRRCDQDAPMLAPLAVPAWTLGLYTGPLRAMVLAWKSHARTDIAPLLLRAAREAAARWAGQHTWAPAPRTVVVVPAPSGWRRRVARRLVAADLAVAVGRGLADALPADGAPTRVLVLDLLRRRGGPRHQAGLGARGRAAGRRGTVHRVADLPHGAAVVLVDDVLTTGATLAECVRVLGVDRVVAALVVAATPPRAAAAEALT